MQTGQHAVTTDEHTCPHPMWVTAMPAFVTRQALSYSIMGVINRLHNMEYTARDLG